MLHEYKFLIFYILLSILILSILYSLAFFLIQKEWDYEKLSAYECGFYPFEDARNTFNVKFYLVAIFFIIFDLEIMYILPWSITYLLSDYFGMYILYYFLILLLVGFLYEWKQGGLDF